MKITMATNIVTPYRIPLFSKLAATEDWELTVLGSSETEKNRFWIPQNESPFRYKNSLNLSFERRINYKTRIKFTDTRQLHIPIGLLFDLVRFKPDVVISSEMGARSLFAVIYTVIMRKKLILWAYNTMHTESYIGWKRRLFRKFLCRFSNAFIGMGKEARQYLENLGVCTEIIFDAKNATEPVKLETNILQEHRKDVREKIGVSGLVYLYVGHFIERKGILYLIKAWETFSERIENKTSLLLVGDGKEKEYLLNLVKKTGSTNIKFLPFIQPENLYEIYAIADVFVFPTLGDVWGLVVNEAMGAGLPVICSKYAGCNPDLIVEGKNGWVIDPLDQNDFVEKLQIVWTNRKKLKYMGKSSQKIISCINLDKMADGFRRAVQFAITI